MNRILLTVLLLFFAFTGFAKHLKGGFFTYTFLNKTATQIHYNITLTVYMECNATASQVDSKVNFTFFDVSGNKFISAVEVDKTSEKQLVRDTDEECITGDQRGCYYKVVTYELKDVALDLNSSGYTVSFQRCCRIEGINNISQSGTVGNTYSITIPGTSTGYETNSSARFKVNDTYVVCSNSPFSFSFDAEDPNGDILKYSFCDAWSGATSEIPAPTKAAAPPYQIVPYTSGYTGTTPLGGAVTIDPTTGLVKGTAPSIPGEYVVTVCVGEYKGNTLIATTRKELHLVVGNCVPIQASLDPDYITCDGYTLTFQNNAPSNDIKTYFWDFGNGVTSTNPVATVTFTTAGPHPVKLVVNRGQQCADSTTTVAKVYPGFVPDFDVNGICITKPTKFIDKTTATFGTVNGWSWDFGNTATNNDVSSIQNPIYTYNAANTYKVRLIATSSLGCRDTIIKDVKIIDKPDLSLRFKDTLICNGDALQLEAKGNGIFSWSPAGTDMMNENTATPTVSPTATKKYYVQLDDNGCLNRDSVRVRVVDFVTLQARGDTTICATDSVQLSAVSDGLKFLWTPSGTLNNPHILNPMARPTATQVYTITARIGPGLRCVATDDVKVSLVPYPGVNAGLDTLICYNTPAQLQGSIVGSSFNWSPSSTLINANTLSPSVRPLKTTTAYVLTVRDTLGCPKPSRDTVIVNVLPKINAFAGRDTAVVINQPLQFAASGGVDYQWSPGTSLSATDIPNPVGMYRGDFDSIRYKVLVYNEANCVDSAYVTVKVFRTNPSIFVPTAFTPNKDSRNETFRPIAVGISRIDYFRVFNRWGQLVFSTTINGHGWDGKIGGKDQGTGTFVWVVKGIDYTGKPFFSKGTVTLIH
jgi:gliding motility-associated-like protein